MKDKGRKWALLLSILVAALVFASILPRVLKREERPFRVEIPIQKEAKEIRLYFSSPEMKGFVPQTLYIEGGRSLVDETRSALNGLIKGPKDEDLVPTIPPGTKIREVYISRGVAYPDFSRDLVKNHWGGTTGELHTVYSIVNTLVLNFDEIERVQLLIEGKEIKTLCGHLDLSRPLGPAPELISQTGGRDAKKEKREEIETP